MSGYYGSATDAQILAQPRRISDATVAIFLGISSERVERVRSRNPERQPDYARKVGVSLDNRREFTDSAVGGPAVDHGPRDGSAALLRALVRYFRNYHPASDVARLDLGA